MRIYLAGKMDQLGNWRDGLLDVMHDEEYDPPRPSWETAGRYEALDACVSFQTKPHSALLWQDGIRGIVLGAHDYVGPFRSRMRRIPSEYKGTQHGSDGRGCGDKLDGSEQSLLVALCRGAIFRSDIVFAYVNSFDSFGTFAEIGYAAALNKTVTVVEREDCVQDDSLWFIRQLAQHRYVYSATGDPDHEQSFLRSALLETISAHAAWRERASNLVPVGTLARQSFEQILHWTSDPRVRAEARRMIKKLGGE